MQREQWDLVWVSNYNRIFALFSWFPISNIRHYSVHSEYSHYSVGFEFRIFATIRSEANIRLRNHYSKTESSNRIFEIRLTALIRAAAMAMREHTNTCRSRMTGQRLLCEFWLIQIDLPAIFDRTGWILSQFWLIQRELPAIFDRTGWICLNL